MNISIATIISRRSFFALLLIPAFLISVNAQGNEVFSDPNVDYSFDVPDDRWKMTAKPSVTNPNVEFVFNDRLDGHLEVRKMTFARTVSMADILKEEEQKLQFMPGFVAGREENFGGHLNGAILNFEFIRAGRPMAGRYYYLRSGDSVYVLRFSGMRDRLRSVRNQTDTIARTFRVRQAG
ncbi:MAG TPA: hypothetical protein PKD24_12550 [Pyrinomonadaceae bacterium]|nr:hypothetical protein [Pyrinomonadaceae bacterium]HMP66497.1 hypothetical protein [Pyrinomonadaceae bacterium]